MLMVYGHDAIEMMGKYTWDQLFLLGECMALAEAQRIDMMMGPIIQALGGKWKPGGPVRAMVEQSHRKARRPPPARPNLTPEQAKAIDDARMKHATAWASKIPGIAVDWGD